MSADKSSIVVLISGAGSNLQALIEACNAGRIAGKIAAVISNNAQAYGLVRAKEARIPTHIITHTAYSNRLTFDQALIQQIDCYTPTLVVLAGFLRVLTPEFIHHYQGRLLNIHPSLLPKFPGLDTHQRALDAGENVHGATVHFVTPELDSGPRVVQAQLDIIPGETARSLAQRVLALEHSIYPLAIQWVLEGRLKMGHNGPEFDGKPLTTPIVFNT